MQIEHEWSRRSDPYKISAYLCKEEENGFKVNQNEIGITTDR